MLPTTDATQEAAVGEVEAQVVAALAVIVLKHRQSIVLKAAQGVEQGVVAAEVAALAEAACRRTASLM